ncbi:lipid A/FlgG phosphoethanolamine transferase EptC [Helicobacter valdiviensis]|uniref:Lipid A/FlgG phosphoethanolamine transferase EptC n=1 Tax=Helicobacter valdiviensis TaxID=1458358 RepID=A0A2W6MW11_9HELI|nr:phosphoethanolamine--lipid A transferase [Helicobacter valdiviensis]PZT48151.1 lipid A/FlgG phosphoethanolamine transferase EptC [Helicobacter valdiviensis]
MKIKISWLGFVLFSALLITFMNFKLFSYIYSNLAVENALEYFILFPIIYFALLVAIFSLLFFRFSAKILLSLFVIITFFSVYFMQSYGVIIDSQMITNAMQTDFKESSELLGSWKLFLLFVTCVLLPLIFVFKMQIAKTRFMIRGATFGISLLVAVLLLGVFSTKLVPFFRNYNDARMYNAPFYQIYSAMKYFKNTMKHKEELEKIAVDAKMQEQKHKKILVLVVGETARAENYSLGGYNAKTNPYTPEENVVFFENVSSCGTATAISLPCMFSLSKRSEFSNNEYRENVLDVLSRVGVSVSWFGNNSGGCKGVCDRLEQKQILREEYDGILLQKLQNKLQNLEDTNLIVLHLQGSHGPTYYKRYPKEFEKFTPTCQTNDLARCSKEELHNTYNNTIVYTDYLIEEMIDLLKKKSDYKAALLYVSDHGESLGESGVYLHGMPYLIAPKVQKHVPMIFWSNDRELNQYALSNQKEALSHDNLYSTLLGFFKVTSKTYETKFDILNAGGGGN